jgi:hypothetical protein
MSAIVAPLWRPEYDDLYVASRSDLSYRYTANAWATTQWYPRVIGTIVVPSLIPLLAWYEHILHIPTELTIWWRLFQRKRTKRGVMPLAILWLRYMTMALGIVYAVGFWSPHQTLATCAERIWPLQATFITIVSMSTACINAWRSRTLTQAAFQSHLNYRIMQVFCVFLLLVRLVALIAAFVFARSWYEFLPLLQEQGDPNRRSTCASAISMVFEAIHLSPTTQEPSSRSSKISLITLLATLVATDLAFAVTTLASILRLSRNIQTRSTLITSLFNNSIMFYSILIAFDLAGVAYFVSTSDADTLALISTVAAILTVRVLINEQETILAASVHTHNDWTRARIRREGAAAWTVHNHANVAAAAAAAVPTNAPQHSHQVPAGRTTCLAERDVADACDACYLRGPVVGLGGRHWNRQPITRRGAGLTDIERVSVIEGGISIQESWARQEDEERAYGATSWPRRTQGGGEHHGIQTLIRDWWRDVEGSATAAAIQARPSAMSEVRTRNAEKRTDAEPDAGSHVEESSISDLHKADDGVGDEKASIEEATSVESEEIMAERQRFSVDDGTHDRSSVSALPSPIDGSE